RQRPIRASTTWIQKNFVDRRATRPCSRNTSDIRSHLTPGSRASIVMSDPEHRRLSNTNWREVGKYLGCGPPRIRDPFIRQWIACVRHAKRVNSATRADLETTN